MSLKLQSHSQNLALHNAAKFQDVKIYVLQHKIKFKATFNGTSFFRTGLSKKCLA
jgi:hypothetical protein